MNVVVLVVAFLFFCLDVGLTLGLGLPLGFGLGGALGLTLCLDFCRTLTFDSSCGTSSLFVLGLGLTLDLGLGLKMSWASFGLPSFAKFTQKPAILVATLKSTSDGRKNATRVLG